MALHHRRPPWLGLVHPSNHSFARPSIRSLGWSSCIEGTVYPQVALRDTQCDMVKTAQTLMSIRDLDIFGKVGGLSYVRLANSNEDRSQAGRGNEGGKPEVRNRE